MNSNEILTLAQEGKLPWEISKLLIITDEHVYRWTPASWYADPMADSALHLQVRQPHAFRAIPHLDPALHARLISALLRPDLNLKTRAKIEIILNSEKPYAT